MDTESMDLQRNDTPVDPFAWTVGRLERGAADVQDVLSDVCKLSAKGRLDGDRGIKQLMEDERVEWHASQAVTVTRNGKTERYPFLGRAMLMCGISHYRYKEISATVLEKDECLVPHGGESILFSVAE